LTAVIKSNGKFILRPDPANAARKGSEQDKAALQKELSSADLRNLLLRILLRLERLESD
jgi:predicted site-specific integrase-resolvase